MNPLYKSGDYKELVDVLDDLCQHQVKVLAGPYKNHYFDLERNIVLLFSFENKVGFLELKLKALEGGYTHGTWSLGVYGKKAGNLSLIFLPQASSLHIIKGVYIRFKQVFDKLMEDITDLVRDMKYLLYRGYTILVDREHIKEIKQCFISDYVITKKYTELKPQDYEEG